MTEWSSGRDMAGTLVIPSSIAAAVDYARAAAARGERVVGASSLPGDENKSAFSAWEWLPSIHDPGFPEAVVTLAMRHGLSHVHAPLTTVHAAVKALIDDGRLPLKLVRPNPVTEQNEAVRRALQRAETLFEFMADIAGGGAVLPSLPQVAAVLHYAGSVYGESSDTKLAAMLAVAASAPKGDVVEIGTMMGKSASVLVHAARLFDIGAVLTVDPWTPFNAMQHESPSLVRDVVDLWDFELLRQGYFLNMIPISGGRANHLRMASADGVAVYQRTRRVETPELGLTTYSGRIALLHVDGNHDIDAVRTDWDSWGRYMLPGGWVIFDDYCWHHGTGPREIGDSILDGAVELDRSFVCGGALFIRLAEQHTT